MKKCSYRQKFSATLHQRGKSRTGDKHCMSDPARQQSSKDRGQTIPLLITSLWNMGIHGLMMETSFCKQGPHNFVFIAASSRLAPPYSKICSPSRHLINL